MGKHDLDVATVLDAPAVLVDSDASGNPTALDTSNALAVPNAPTALGASADSDASGALSSSGVSAAPTASCWLRGLFSAAVSFALVAGLAGCGTGAAGDAAGRGPDDSGADLSSLSANWDSANDDSLLLGQAEALEALATLGDASSAFGSSGSSPSASGLSSGSGASSSSEVSAGLGVSGGSSAVDLSDAAAAIPAYNGYPSVAVNDNVPLFSEADLGLAEKGAFEEYANLDSLGRAMGAAACAGLETMPTEERGNISEVHPTGWHSSHYDWVDGGSLYNRCHLAGYQLTAENANEKNLITGTRYMNVDGMLPYENEVADYIDETGGHVLYRVTPVYAGSELVARGVLMEAYSVEDEGAALSFCVYCFNVQPGVSIDYATGDNAPDGSGGAGLSAGAGSGAGSSAGSDGGLAVGSGAASSGGAASGSSSASSGASGSVSSANGQNSSGGQQHDYVLNTGSKKIHKPSCEAVEDMKEANKLSFYGTLEEAEALGYKPCGRCKP